MRPRRDFSLAALTLSGLLGAVAAGCGGSGRDDDGAAVAAIASFASESGTIQITDDDARVAVLNKGAARGSLTVLRVKDQAGADARVKLGEVQVGGDPQSVSIDAAGTRAYVSNGADATISVVDLVALKVESLISVGAEPRGTALSPSGRRLYVAESADGTLVEIDTTTGAVLGRTSLAASGVLRPHAVTVTNDGDADDTDESVVVADFFARPRPGLSRDQVEGFDDGKEGRVAFVSAATRAVTDVAVLSPMASGFTADRSKFQATAVPAPGKTTFATTAPDPTKDPQDVLFNQLHAISVDPATGRLYVDAIGASPEPPVKFNVNIQALVGVVDPTTRTAIASAHVNLNDQIKVETQPAEPFAGNLVRAFAADTVDASIRNGVALFVSRGGSFTLRASFDGGGKLALGASATTPAVRTKTGSIPNGVILNGTATRAYVNAEVDHTVTVIDLSTNLPLGGPVETADLPAPGTSEHNSLIGKLAFFTGMGLPAEGITGTNVRAIDTHQFRGLASDNNWSSCASCHPGGGSDGITWSFGTGPRQTLPLDASFSKADPQRQRVFNWNAERGSVTDFNNNARGVQGGKGFTKDPATDAGQIFNHGPNAGVSESLDLMTLWVQIGVRTPKAPGAIAAIGSGSMAAGRTAFEALGCADCHGGDQWTSSQVRWAYPLFAADPAGATTPNEPLDPRVKRTVSFIQAFDAQGNASFDDDADGFDDLPIVTRFRVAGQAAPQSPTLDLTNPIELRGAGALLAQNSVGAAASFNPPSLLGLASTAPYGHHGRAETVEKVFAPLSEGGLNHPTNGASAQQLADLRAFLLSIDATTPPVD